MRASSTPPDRPGFSLLLVLCGAICLLVLFWPFFASGLDLTASDPSDGRFELAILEHWVKVFHGHAPVASPNFFYPEKGVLGNSDAFFGLALVHAVFRSLGADRYLAVQLAIMFLVALGFVAMYHLMRAVLSFPRSIALAGTALFVMSNMYYIYVVHPYVLVAVLITPVVFILIAEYWRRKTSEAGKARAYLCSSGVLVALIFYTSYYIGWFLVVCSAALFVSYLACVAFSEGSLRPVSEALKAGWNEKWNLLLAGITFLISLIPFFALYLPSLHRTGKRTLGETLYFMPHALGILDVGRSNLVWGHLSAVIEDFTSPGGIHEHAAGWPLFTVAVFLGTALYCLVQLWRSRRRGISLQDRNLHLMCAIALTCLTLWTAGVRIGNYAPVWAAMMKLVPGAAAIRVPQRVELVLNIGVVIVCMFGLDTLRRRLKAFHSAAYLVPALLVGGMAVEQLNAMPTHLLSRRAEARKFARIPAPPKDCSAFYVSDWSNTLSGTARYQADAMMVAQQYDIPTVNGSSSWFPKGWSLMTAPRGHLGETAIEWAKQKGVSDGLCALDVDGGVWKPAMEEAAEESSAYNQQPVPGEIADSGFEDNDLGYWTRFRYVHATVTNTQIHSGVRSLAESEGEGSAYQDVSGLQPGQRYRISAWVSASPGTTAASYIAIFDMGNNVATSSSILHPDSKWQSLSVTVTASHGGTLRIHLFRTEGEGTIYWDDVSIQPDGGSDTEQSLN